MKYIRGFAYFLLVIVIILIQACGRSNELDESRLKTEIIHSKILGKDMKQKVYLPKEYGDGNKYPVLYFIHDGGGSADTVIYQYEIAQKSDELVKNKQIEPLIIVAVRIDSSFGINSSTETTRVELQYQKVFDQGMYEDYIINEVIPYIDTQYSTISSREGRYIGGYSMGGFAALYIAFRYNNMFCKAGGHSPSLFIKEFPDKYISDWLYPDEDIRKNRDPIYIAREKDLSGLTVYLDTGETDVNVEGCRLLYDILQKKGIESELHLFPGTHSRSYCNMYMDKYLLFYTSK